jgi:hypothetical protein
MVEVLTYLVGIVFKCVVVVIFVLAVVVDRVFKVEYVAELLIILDNDL